MTPRELKDKYIEFFVKQGHREIPSASLIPENDPTTLFISAGMHPLVPYLLGQPHPLGKRLVNVQKCVRTGDIDEVGDTFHHTFFEMLGNWSLGDYFKKEMIPWSYTFLTQVLGINPKHLHVTCFEGDADAPKDEDSAKIWQEQGIDPSRIHFLPKKDNWWGPAGSTGPCGPDTEMFMDTHPEKGEISFEDGCRQGRIVEIWNDVFMQYNKNSEGKYVLLSQQNVDTGMGVERTVAVLNGFDDNYRTQIWQPIIQKIEQLCQMEYGDKTDSDYINEDKQCWVDVRKSMRLIADHLRAAVFIIADGVEPSNKEAGYVLRRLIRRSIRQGKILGINDNFTAQVAQSVLDNQDNLAGVYPELNQFREHILEIVTTEENKFRKTLNSGLREIEKYKNELSSPASESKPKHVKYRDMGYQAFYFYESFGFPLEMFLEEIKDLPLGIDQEAVRSSFEEAKNQHTEKSRTLSAGKFKSGLADHGEITTKYHTATHLLHAALRQVLGSHVQQSGSNLNSERLRFDFSHPDKLTEDQLGQVASIVNQQIQAALPVTVETLPFVQAQSQGALAFFGAKYPEMVTVYTVGDSNQYFSKEVCTGPHVDNTSKLGKFEIIKEESAGSGKRRIYAVLK